jgi:hypothetical protein
MIVKNPSTISSAINYYAMKTKEKESALYKRIDEIVWHEWDPIGVNDSEVSRDEYYSYLPSLYKKLIEDADVKGITNYLNHIETVNIGLSGNPQKNISIAEMLINARNSLMPG